MRLLLCALPYIHLGDGFASQRLIKHRIFV